MAIIGLILWCGVIGCIPAAIAQGRGRRFGGWWLFGTLLFVVALPCALMIPNDQAARDRQALKAGNRKCPSCAEVIRREARVCRYCGRDVAPSAALA